MARYVFLMYDAEDWHDTTDELAANVSAALTGRTAAVMRHHGTLVLGDTLAVADTGARHLEWLCDVWLRAAAVGTPRELTEEQLADVTRRFAGYGQSPREHYGRL